MEMSPWTNKQVKIGHPVNGHCETEFRNKSSNSKRCVGRLFRAPDLHFLLLPSEKGLNDKIHKMEIKTSKMKKNH